MKYYLGTIDERNGEMEYSDKYLFQTKGSPEKYTNKTAMKWRGSNKSDWDDFQNGYWSDCTLIFNGGHKEIPKEHYEVLSKYLAVL